MQTHTHCYHHISQFSSLKPLLFHGLQKTPITLSSNLPTVKMKISLSFLGLIAMSAALPQMITRQDNDLLFCEEGVDTQGDTIGSVYGNGMLEPIEGRSGIMLMSSLQPGTVQTNVSSPKQRQTATRDSRVEAIAVQQARHREEALSAAVSRKQG